MQISADMPPLNLGRYLYNQKLLITSPEQAQISIPGEGNMNTVLRYQSGGQSLIVKQSHSYVRKYPQVDAPIDRIATEAAYYDAISPFGVLTQRSPKVLHFDPKIHLMVMEDLGNTQDLTKLYQPDVEWPESLALDQLEYLSELHEQCTAQSVKDYPKNQALKALNHQHIFILPFIEDNGFDLDAIQAGLQELANHYKRLPKIKDITDALGQQYLETKDTLIHGDYYPGSWIENEKGELYIIDPEFSYLGMAEFDLAVWMAHGIFSGIELDELIIWMQKYYRGIEKLNESALNAMAGVEIMRRLIGLAQLPLHTTLEVKGQWLNLAVDLIMDHS